LSEAAIFVSSAAGSSAGADAVGVSLVMTGFAFGAFSGAGILSIGSQLIVNSAILAAERPQQPPVAGSGFETKTPSARAAPIIKGFRMEM
jgi:hypothetical protein